MNRKPIFVTQPALPPLEEYVELLQGVWERGILTHNGPLVQQFERELCARLGIGCFVAVSNGTIAIQMAIKALAIKGEIITTPFTWVATVSAIQWEGCRPVFCDIDPETLNMDPTLIESHITAETRAIMPVHVFGNPCDIDAIQAIARKHGLTVIYDAAHAIGSVFRERSLLECGDISATSLHATKLLNTAEGGGCVTGDPALAEKLRRIRFFGHDHAKNVVEGGFNGKMTEIHAALGLANLKYHEAVLADRKHKYSVYRDVLKTADCLSFQILKHGEPNYSYFPVIFPSEEALLRVQEHFAGLNIFPRRYFYPSVNTYTHIVDYQPAPVSEAVSRRILCLPLYRELPENDVIMIAETILRSIT